MAIKQLLPGLVGNDDVRSRFLVEARVLAQMAHPHIVPVYDYVEHDDVCALVMASLGGGTVWDRFVAEGFNQRTSCAIALVACSALQGAHDLGVLHRDMKPDNILFGEGAGLRVTDFGIAKVLGDDDTLATPEGGLLGTPAYMAPEQASGSGLGPGTDIYAVGVMLYELLCGRLPFSEVGGPLAIVLRHVNEAPIPLADVTPDVPPALVDVVMQALQHDPGDRFESAEAFGVAIAEASGRQWGPRWLDGLPVALGDPGPILEAARVDRGTVGSASAGRAAVRPEVELHVEGVGDDDVVLGDLLPLRRVPVEIPSRRLVWSAIAVAVVAALLGLFGVGSSPPTPTWPAGTVSVAGHDPATTSWVSADLGRPITVTLHHPPPAPGRPARPSWTCHSAA